MQQQSLTVTFTCKEFFNVVTLNCCTILKPDESHNTAGSFFWLVQLLAIMSIYSSPSSGSQHHFRWTRKSHGRKCRAWIFSSSFFIIIIFEELLNVHLKFAGYFMQTQRASTPPASALTQIGEQPRWASRDSVKRRQAGKAGRRALSDAELN